jgi:putative hydrolase of the HAD superfamily
MEFGAIRAICFDLDNTLWEIEPVLLRAERILADWLHARYPRIPERVPAAEMLVLRAALLRDEPHQALDLSFPRRETLLRAALADALTLSPAEILFVGDDPHADVIGPRASGMRTAWINRAGAAWPADVPPADLHVAHVGELATLLAEA